MKADELYDSDDDLILFFHPDSTCTDGDLNSFPNLNVRISSYIDNAAENGIILDYYKYESYFNATTYMNYRGSFAYKTVMCSKSGRNCAIILQLNNQADYTVNFSLNLTKWHIVNAFEWLAKQLDQVTDSSSPIFINVHKLNLVSYLKIEQMLRKIISRNSKMLDLRVFLVVSYNCLKIIQKCIADRFVPVVQVASVFSNWYTAVKIPANQTDTIPVLLFSSSPNRTINIIDAALAKTGDCFRQQDIETAFALHSV
uniref:CRAL-TRIO domain-containing protein n=1 Tax=Setaria digitata TaxID=48799 RepID=A0A915PNA8_9BILA